MLWQEKPWPLEKKDFPKAKCASDRVGEARSFPTRQRGVCEDQTSVGVTPGLGEPP